MIKACIVFERFFRRWWSGIALRVRSLYWRHHFGACESGLVVGGRLLVKQPQNISAGRGVLIAEEVYINARGPVSLGKHVRLSAFVRINTGALDFDTPPDQRSAHIMAPVHIEDDVWLATGVIVNPGVTIHEGAVVGAGAVVVCDLPPYTLCVGVPAKPVRDLPRPAARASV